MRGTGNVEKRLIHGNALDEGRVVSKHLKGLVGDLLVERHAGLYEDAVRTALEGRAGGHGRMDAEPARLVGTGRNHAAFVRTCADNDGLAAPLRVVALLHGREERIHVHVQYACSICRHGPIIAYSGGQKNTRNQSIIYQPGAGYAIMWAMNNGRDWRDGH